MCMPHGVFDYGRRSNDCDRYLCHVTGTTRVRRWSGDLVVLNFADRELA